MDIDKIKRNAIISSLSGISKYKNEREIECSINNVRATIELVDEKNTVIRTYRKNGSLYSYTEYTNNERNGVTNIFYSDGKLKNHSIVKNGNLMSAITFHENGKLCEKKQYKNGKLHRSEHHQGEWKTVKEYKWGKLWKKILYKNGIKCNPITLEEIVWKWRN